MTATVAALALGATLTTVVGSSEKPASAKPPTARSPRVLDEDGAQEKARHSGKPVEVTALRTATDTTFARPDGSFELTAHSLPVRAKVHGVWKDIDTTLKPVKGGGWAAAAVNHPAVFSGGSAHRSSRTTRRAAFGDASAPTTPLVTLSTGGHELTVTWPGTLPEPVIAGPRALYEEVLPGVDLLLTARDSGFSHLLVVKDAQAAADPALAQLSYGLTSPDLTFFLDPVSQAVTAKDSLGNEAAVSPSPYMWDSAGKPAVTQGDDPEPAPPAEEPAPDFSEEPGEAPTGSGPSESDDTAAPTPGPTPETDAPDTGAPSLAHRVLFSREGSGDAPATLSRPGLAGPQPGTHDAIAEADLKDGTLAIVPDTRLLKASSTVFPVFIDPSFTAGTDNWTTAYRTFPSSSFWNGTNFNDGTDTARVGYESTTGGLSRSFFQLDWNPALKGAHVSSASFYAKETYAWSCEGRTVELWLTGSVTSKTTWNNQPAWRTPIDSQDVAHGYNSGCPDNYVKFTATSVAQQAADGAWPNITVGLRAADEESAKAWKKFQADGSGAPYLKATYNRKPKEPVKYTMTPGPDCDTASPYQSVGKSSLTFAATGSDPDGDLKYLDFEVWLDGSSTKILDSNRSVDSSGHASVTVDSTKFANGKTYVWQVRSLDSTGAASTYAPPGATACRFVYDSAAPNSPVVTSAGFPEDDGSGGKWSAIKFGTAGSFTFSPEGAKDVTKIEYSFNGGTYGASAPVTAGADVTRSLQPPVAGPNVLYARSVDAGGNPSAATKYVFYVTPRDTADTAGDVTGDAQADLFVVDEGGNLRLYPGNRAAGDIHVSLPAAHDKGINLTADTDGDEQPDHPGYWMNADGDPALITHNGDFLPGDGVQDLVARMPDGKLYAYRGDGYGSVDISQRTELLLPDNAPDPSSFTQILAAGDVNNDKRPDLFVTSGTALWAFLGYTGGTFTSATQLTSTSWDVRDLVTVGDVNRDGEMDLVYRTFASDRLLLRLGRPDAGGGTTLESLASAANSLNGTDAEYGTGWSAANFPLLTGTPDVNADGIPDIWALTGTGTVRFYAGTKTSAGTGTEVISGGWSAKKSFG
ncbi:FG-GAP-like repeat-containing protein [Streptomyces sp. NPDC006923]|uniref:FG-GAP-like repeat-containing protein n=1 Tax=Streptomyces sp. NPDC006923 TaxID=3155355 RepID=UPI0033D39544